MSKQTDAEKDMKALRDSAERRLTARPETAPDGLSDNNRLVHEL